MYVDMHMCIYALKIEVEHQSGYKTIQYSLFVEQFIISNAPKQRINLSNKSQHNIRKLSPPTQNQCKQYLTKAFEMSPQTRREGIQPSWVRIFIF